MAVRCIWIDNTVLRGGIASFGFASPFVLLHLLDSDQEAHLERAIQIQLACDKAAIAEIIRNNVLNPRASSSL